MFNRVGTGLGAIKTAVNSSCSHFAELPRAVPLQYFQGVQIQSGIDALERRERMEWWPKGGRKRKRKLKLRLRQHHSTLNSERRRANKRAKAKAKVGRYDPENFGPGTQAVEG